MKGHEFLKMISNIAAFCLLICVTSVSPDSSVAVSAKKSKNNIMPNEITNKVGNIQNFVVPRHKTIHHHYSNMQQIQKLNSDQPNNVTNFQITHQLVSRRRRHTPFLPGDHWKGLRPDFGPTETDIEVMVNGTAKMKCPITHVSDNRVSFVFKMINYAMCFYFSNTMNT